MISRLTGRLVEITNQSITLDVGDVGYQVFATEQWKAQATIGNKYMMSISTQVRDDAIELYGFSDVKERQLFTLLLTVSGIGPKTALAIMAGGVSAIQNAIIHADVDFFSQIPRIGKKNAQKIIIELKSKLGGITDLDLSDDTYSKNKELFDALLGMGFSKQEVQKVLKEELDSDNTLEVNLRKALKILGKK